MTLAARGVAGPPRDTVHAARQALEGRGPWPRVEASVPPLSPGLYRIGLRLLAPDAGEALAEAERVVVVRRWDYPRLTRLGDLVEPLVYLAGPGEVARLRAAARGPGGRAAFDRFWGEEIDDRRVAAAALQAYYGRVEEANRLFATHKDGWKTDPGMAYVLFGPPAYVDRTPTGETWSYRGGAAPPVLVFEQTAGLPGDGSPTSALTLVRDRQYHEAWLRARRDWRTGRTR
jgi:GWxTD domain-containing protein